MVQMTTGRGDDDDGDGDDDGDDDDDDDDDVNVTTCLLFVELHSPLCGSHPARMALLPLLFC